MDYAFIIFKAGHHLLSLSYNILDMSKIEGVEYRLWPALVDIRDLLRSIISLMQPRANSGGASIDLSAVVTA